MSTEDYKRAAAELRGLRLELFAYVPTGDLGIGRASEMAWAAIEKFWKHLEELSKALN